MLGGNFLRAANWRPLPIAADGGGSFSIVANCS